MLSRAPSVETLRDVKLQTPMQVFTKDGQMISQFGEKRQFQLSLRMSHRPWLMLFSQLRIAVSTNTLALIPRGAFGVLITTGEVKEGASTITMQLARNFFLSFDRADAWEIKETFIALHIEQLLTKDEILELYLNKIAFGHRAYGVGAAAQVYYGKALNELSLAQIATIAGLPKAPSNLNPISNPQASSTPSCSITADAG